MWDEESYYHELRVTMTDGDASHESLTRADLVFGLDDDLPLSGCGGCRDFAYAPCRRGEHLRGWAYKRWPERDEVLADLSRNLPDLLLVMELTREDRPDLMRRVYYYA